MYTIYSVVLLATGILILTLVHVVNGITATTSVSVSSSIVVIPTRTIIENVPADASLPITTLTFAFNRIRGGGTAQDSSNIVSDEDGNDDESENDSNIDSVMTTTTSIDDNVDVPTVIYDGSFKEALLYAKQQGRLLIAFIPQKPHSVPSSKSSSQNNENDAKSIDNLIMQSFTSIEVAKAAQKAPPKSKQIKLVNQSAGSFVLWCCSNGISSPEATSLLKRIQGGTVQYKNASGQKRPILVALYPHASTTTASLVVPRLLTQHHCSPPPTTAKFVEWLQTIRKVNKKYYVKLQKQIQEYQWEQERRHGYQSSMKSDIEAKQRETKQELERQRLAQEEKEKIEQIQKRRLQLLQELDDVTVNPSTPSTSTHATTIALRFNDRRSATGSTEKQPPTPLQRTFNERAAIRDIFHWIDAVHEIPYETITLQTMNGKRTFVYDDRTCSDDDDKEDDDGKSDSNNTDIDVLLHEAGLGKMVGLRVIMNK
jgi:hypothetical protein